MAAAYLERACCQIEHVPIPFAQLLDHAQWALLRQAMQAGINAPLSSSMGRLFDAVSALLGVRGWNNYEGQAASELEQMASAEEREEYAFAIADEEGGLILDPDPVIAAITEEIMYGEAPAVISARFHNAVARAIAQMAIKMREATGLSEIVLSGGVFQNHLLLARACDFLTDAGCTVYCHHQVPANDGGIALGQAWHAIHVLKG
jgi:hydrogenase maturation protein HypF